jgi:hypothetical protein
MTPSGIEAATFRFVAQYLNHYATAVPTYMIYLRKRGWVSIGKRRTVRKINDRGFLYVITPFALMG